MALTVLEKAKLADIGRFIVERFRFDIHNKKITKYGEVNASGKLANSLRFEVYDDGLRIWAEDYIFYLEKGRRPGKFPPPDAIKDWIKAKSIDIPTTYLAKWTLKDGTLREAVRDYTSEEVALNSLAYLIGRKLANKGTTIFEQGGSDLISDIVNDDLVSMVTEQVSDLLVKSINSQVLNIKFVA